MITPVFLSYTYLLAFDDLDRFYDLWTFKVDLSVQAYNSSNFLIPLVVIGVTSLIAVYPTTKRSLLAKIDFKSTWSVLLTHIGVSLIISLMAADKNGSELIFLLFPLSVLLANYLQVINRYWLKEMLLYIFIFTFFSNYL